MSVSTRLDHGYGVTPYSSSDPDTLMTPTLKSSTPVNAGGEKENCLDLGSPLAMEYKLFITILPSARLSYNKAFLVLRQNFYNTALLVPTQNSLTRL